MKVSATLINKNEEDFLEMTLKSIRDEVDEIVMVDTGSTDNSIAIARKYVDKLLETEWKYDFGYHRNQVLELASNDWVLVVAADCPWVKLEEDTFQDIALRAESKETDIAVFPHFEFWFEMPIVSWAAIQSGNNGPLFNRNNYHWYGKIHEMLSSKEPEYFHSYVDSREVLVDEIAMPTTVYINPPMSSSAFVKHHYRYLKKDKTFALRDHDYNMVYFGKGHELSQKYFDTVKEEYKKSQNIDYTNIPAYSCEKVAIECCHRTSEERVEAHFCTGPFPEGIEKMDWIKQADEAK